MKNKVVRAIVVKIALAFVAVFALMVIVGLIVPVGNADPASDNVFPSDLSLLNFDDSRNYQRVKMSEVGTKNLEDNAEYEKKYDGEQVFDWEEDAEDITFKVNIAKAGDYQIAVDYLSCQTTVNTISLNVTANKTTHNNIELQSAWIDSTNEEIFDIYGNEVSPVQKPVENLWRNVFLYDQRYYQQDPVVFALKAGENEVVMHKNEGHLKVGAIYFVEVKEFDNYKSPQKNDAAKDELITLEAENPFFKSTPEIGAASQQNVSVTPYSTDNNLLNVISGDSFNKSGYSVTYAFNVEKAGNYNISMKYYISQTNTSVYSKIFVDNVILNKELNSYEFKDRTKYNNETLNVNGENMEFYFEKGIHTITIQLDASLQSVIYYEMSNIISEINSLYMEIIKLTGGTVDKDMVWKIDNFIKNPSATERLNNWKERLENLLELTNEISKSDSSKQNRLYQNINNAYDKLCDLAKDPNKLPHKLNILSEGSSSISNMLSDSLHTATFSPLSLDKIYIHGSDAKLPNPKANGFLTFFATIQRVFKSGVEERDDDVVEIWVNRSTYYVSLMQQYADAYYNGPKKIRFSLLPDESKITYANASGTNPDAALGVSSTVPYDMGIRGALVDLRQMPGFNDVIKEYTPGAFINMMECDKVYGLPETQDFNITYYRKDLVEMLGVESVIGKPVPETYEEIIEIVPLLQAYGMNYHMPLAGGSGLKSIAATAPIIYQYGGDIYSPDYMTTAIDSTEAIEAMNMMVDLFNIYSLPLTSQSFYNTFRSGTIPIGVAGFEVYLQLTTAAPEIAGQWDVALAPGVKKADGTIDRTNTADAKGVVIFEKSEYKEEAWDFIKWWLSSDIQARFANDIEATYGPTFLWNTANINAFAQLPIDDHHKEVILEQWTHTRNIAQTPATYIIERCISNVWNAAVFDQAPIRAQISDAVLEINKEMKRKMEEFGYYNNPDKPYYVPTVEEVKSWKDKEEE